MGRLSTQEQFTDAHVQEETFDVTPWMRNVMFDIQMLEESRLEAGIVIKQSIDRAVDCLSVRLRRDVLSRQAEPVRIPEDWWEAFKERWFPSWLYQLFSDNLPLSWSSKRFFCRPRYRVLTPMVSFFDYGGEIPRYPEFGSQTFHWLEYDTVLSHG